jgi:putative PEP-CTERM system TPR-repeat lipoprotein
LATSVNAQSSDNYEKALQSFHSSKINETFIHLKNALEEDPNHLPSKILLAKVLVLKGEDDAAIYYINEAIALGADANLTTITLAKAYMHKREFLKVIALSDTNLSKQNQIELILLQASALQNTKRNDEAIIKYQQVMAMQPNNIIAISGITSLYLGINDINKATIYLSKLKELDPESATYFFIQGQLYEREGKTQEALTFIEKAFSISPSDAIIARSLANLYINLRKYEKARTIVNKIIEAKPNDPFLMLLNARLYTITKENKLADDVYNELSQKLQLVPDEIISQMPELLYVSGLTDYMMGSYETAQKKLLAFTASNKENLNAILLLADIYLKQDKVYNATSLLEKNITLVENNLPISIKLCNLYLQDNKAFKCNSMLEDLNRIHGNNDALNYLQVKVLLNYKQYPEALTFFEQKLSSNQSVRLKYLAISLYMLNNKPKLALGVINELLSQNPTNIDFQLTKSEILIELSQLDQADLIISNVLEKKPDSLKAQFNQAKIFYLKGNYTTAQKQAEKLLVNEPDNLEIYTLLGNSLVGQRKFDSALNIFLKAKKLAKDNPEITEQIVNIYRLSGKLDLALDELTSLGKQFFLEPKYIEQKAEIYVQQKKYELAKHEFNLLLSLWSDDPKLLLKLGKMQQSAKLYQDAETSFKKSLAINPNNLSAKIELVRVYLLQKQLEKADVLAKQLLKDHPDIASLHLLAGDIEFSKNEFLKAQQYYLSALLLNNNDYFAALKLYNLARTKQIGVSTFEETLLSIISNQPKSYFHRNLIADFYFERNELNKAKAQYEILATVENLPKKQFVYNNLANLYLDIDLVKALNYINKAMEIESSNANFYDTKGWILCLQNNFQQGLNLLRQSYAINSNDPANRYHIAYALIKLDRKSEAKIELDAALSSNKMFTGIEQAKTLRDSL